MVSVPRLFPGSTIVCMATGPSLTQEDADYVRGRCPVIAVNFAIERAPWADVLYSSDRQWWPRTKGLGFTGMRYGVGSGIGKRNPFIGVSGVTVLLNTGMDGLETSPTGLRTGRNSGYAAINLAVHFGAVRVILLGYNMGAAGSRLHYYDERAGFPAHPYLYTGWRRAFETMVEPLKAIGVEVINCTESSSLTAFPYRPLRDVLSARAA